MHGLLLGLVGRLKVAPQRRSPWLLLVLVSVLVPVLLLLLLLLLPFPSLALPPGLKQVPLVLPR